MIKTVTTVGVTIALLLGADARLLAQPSASQVAADEAVKREATIIQLRKKLEEAGSTRKKGELEASARLYEEAYTMVQRVGNGIETERAETISSLVAVDLEIAEKAQRRGELSEAAARVKRALTIDPKNAVAQDFKKANDKLVEQQRGRTPSQEVKSRVPEIKEERIATSTLVQDGRLLYEMGKLDEAEKKLKEAFKRDPENKAAAYYLHLLEQGRYNQEARKREITATERVGEVERAWNTEVKRDLLPDANPFARTNLIYTGTGRQRIQHKLDTIKLSEVVYDGITLGEVLKDLDGQVRRRDPDKRGINFIINSYADVPPTQQVAAGVDANGNPLPAPPPAEPLDLHNVVIRLSLRDVTLGHAIDAISKVSDKPIKFSIEEYAVVFTQRSKEEPELFTRIFRVNPNTFIQGLEAVTGQSLGVGSSGGGGGGVGGGGGGGGVGGGGAGGGGGGVVGYARVDVSGVSSSGGLGGGGGGLGGGGGGGGLGGQGGGGIGIEGVTRTNLLQNIQTVVKSFFATAGVNFPIVQTGIGGAGGQAGGGGFGGGGFPGGGGFGAAGGQQQETGKALFYNDRMGVIFARATLTDLDIMDKAIQVLNITPPVISLEAKFVEISQTDTKMLGFDWFLGNTLLNGGRIGAQGGTAPAYNGPSSRANPSGIFPGYGPGVEPLPQVQGVSTYPPSTSDQLLTGGLRNNTPNAGTPAPALASFTGILTDPQFKMVIRALDQREGVDVLSAPRVTTVSGRQAKIDLTEVKSIVASQNFGGQSSGGGGGGLGGGGGGGGLGGSTGGTGVSASSNFSPQQVPLGPQLDVIPYVDADGYTVEMTIIPTLVQFLGYDDPGPFVPQAQAVAGSSIGTPLVAQLPLPRFRVRQVLTSAIVWDGQTVSLGGLIAEDVTKTKDKVPFLGDIPLLGRLFRSESSQQTKKNLVIFVTPTIIDPAGNRVHLDNQLPYDPKTIPAQTLTPAQ
jgi:Flp pilus assembly secretin CpaC/tetratricopeptide (TPR) repeat protein